MKSTLISIAILAMLAAAPSRAEELAEQVKNLTEEISELRNELLLLHSTLSRDTAGNVVITSTGSRKDLVGLDLSTSIGSNASSSFGRSLALAIGQSRTTQIGANDVLTIAGGSTSSINGAWKLSVGGSATQQFSGNWGVGAAREILIEAGNQILLKTGGSSILMKKDGTIEITGKVISVKASADVVIKGARVQQN